MSFPLQPAATGHRGGDWLAHGVVRGTIEADGHCS